MVADRDPDRSRRTFRALAVAAGLWFIGSGVWGLLTETPADRAASSCEAAASERAADSAASVRLTVTREEQVGWFVAGEVLRIVDNAQAVTHQWQCVADGDGKNPSITAWNPS